LIASCGGSSPGGGAGAGSCTSNASCGGDIVGTWTITQACNVKSVKATVCADQTYAVSDQVQTGTFAFRADGTATQMVRTTGTIAEVFPPACLATGIMTCAETDASYREQVRTGSTYTSASCADNAGSCECDLTFDTTTNVSGTYTTSGSTFTVMGNGNSSTGSYCVTGSTMIINVPRAPDPPAIYVLTRS
jgi:hypothetical protein